MSYFNLFKTKFNYFCWDLSHTLINYLFGNCVKRGRQLNKNCYLLVKKSNRNIIININDVNYSNAFLKNLVSRNINFKINSSLRPYLQIDYLFIEPLLERFLTKKDAINFKIWSNSSSKLIKDINRINNICKHLTSFINVKIKRLDIKIGNFMVRLSNLIIIKNNDKLIIKCNKVCVIHKDIHILKMKLLKMTIYSLKYISSVYVESIVISLREKIIRNDVFEELVELILLFPNEEGGTYPKIFIKELKINLEIHNYMRAIFNNVMLEKEILSVSSLNVKNFKKDILWLSNFTMKLRDNIPVIETIRLRLFNSTGDKIYKTFIFLRKRYLNFSTERRKTMIPNKNPHITINPNYINGVRNLDLIAAPSKMSELKTIKESYLQNYIVNEVAFKFKINQLEIAFEKNQGKFLINELFYESTDAVNTVTCDKWLYFKKNIKYIDKLDTNSKFIIKFGNGVLEIIPYKCFINLDLQQYMKTFSILITTISKITSIFSPNITISKNYIFERFRIDSFYAILSYTKNSFSIGNLIEGNYSEMLNLISIDGVQLLLPELLILYPNTWGEISTKIVNKYIVFMSSRNFKNIVKKTPAAPLLKLSTIKKSLGYLSTKFYKSF